MRCFHICLCPVLLTGIYTNVNTHDWQVLKLPPLQSFNTKATIRLPKRNSKSSVIAAPSAIKIFTHFQTEEKQTSDLAVNLLCIPSLDICAIFCTFDAQIEQV